MRSDGQAYEARLRETERVRDAGRRIAEMNDMSTILARGPLLIQQQAGADRAAYDQALRELRLREIAWNPCRGS